VAKLRRRGCLVVRGHFDREQALGWDREIVRYVEDNEFFENYRGPGDDFFGTVGSKPEIYPIYWSRAQMQARQSEEMARVQAFLNGQWKSQSGGVQWFDPERDSLYPDSRPSGTCSTAASSSTTRGTPRTGPPEGSTRDRRCARRSAPSRAGPPCRTWRTIRGYCIPFRYRGRWRT
jgi:Protein of unknown function (DUF1479)